MKKLIFFILLALTMPALASAEIEVNEITNGEIVVLKTETVYEDGTDCKIVAVQIPRFNIEEVEINCFQPVSDGSGGGDTTTNTDNHTEDNDTYYEDNDTYNEDNDTYYEDNDTYNSEENNTYYEDNDSNYDNSSTKQNGATITINR